MEKIREAVEMLRQQSNAHGRIELWADGGIRREALPELEKLGLDYAVLGRAFFAE